MTAALALGSAYVIGMSLLALWFVRRARAAPAPWHEVSFMQQHRSAHEQEVVNQIGDGVAHLT